MRGRVIVDLRNVMRPEVAADEGFVYYGVGRAAEGISGASGHSPSEATPKAEMSTLTAMTDATDA